MNLRINYKHLVAEFVIVFVGVAVALAADEWRQNIANRQVENIYIARLERDLNAGEELMSALYLRFTAAQDAANTLIGMIDDDNIKEQEYRAIDEFIRAGYSGSTEAQLFHGVTYQELLSTGRITLIRDQRLREALDNYFRLLERIEDMRNSIGNTLANKVTGVTGDPAYVFVLNQKQLSPAARLRITSSLIEDKQWGTDIRHFHGTNRIFLELIEDALKENLELQRKLVQTI